jgi:hypothetical protein
MPVWGHKAQGKPQAKTQMHLTSLSPETAEKVLITNYIKALFLEGCHLRCLWGINVGDARYVVPEYVSYQRSNAECFDCGS